MTMGVAATVRAMAGVAVAVFAVTRMTVCRMTV